MDPDAHDKGETADVILHDYQDVEASKYDGLLYSHANILTHENSGFGGAHISEGVSGLGKTCNGEFWMIENFTVPVGEVWKIGEVEVLAYQTYSDLESTFTGIYFTIHDSDPLANGPPVGLGQIPNIMTSSIFSGMYRVANAGAHSNTDRPIMRIFGQLDATLNEGFYHAMYAVTGSLGSGPFCPFRDEGADTMRQFYTVNNLTYETGGIRSGFKFYEAQESNGASGEEAVPIAAIVAPIVIGVVILGAVMGYFSFCRKKENTVYVQESGKDVEKQ